MSELTAWLARPEPESFPYSAVLDEFRQVGKHFVAESTLKHLALARETLQRADTPGPDHADPSTEQLKRVLDVLLDKWDGTYDYRSYTALPLLPLLRIEDAPQDPEVSQARRDRLVVGLLADALFFERAAAAGEHTLLPEMRPSPDLVAKRYRLGLKVAAPALARLGHHDEAARIPAARTAEAQADVVLAVHRAVAQALSDRERMVLEMSMLPVYVSHDEYLFIRVLQVFETTFAMLVVQLQSAVEALQRCDWAAASAHMNTAAGALTESAPMFSLLATMQVESFRTFRDFTEGASAIQSRSYKLLESLCRAPARERLDSAAYLSTPEVRDRVLAGQQTLEQAYHDALEAGRPTPAESAPATEALGDFAAALRRWKQTHYRLAVRMLGTRSGTGYTEGTPYLGMVRHIPVFTTPALDESAESARPDTGRAQESLRAQ